MSKKKQKPAPLLLAAPVAYTYYVTYTWPDKIGYSVLKLDWPITNHDRIELVMKLIRQGHNIKSKIIITNWILL